MFAGRESVIHTSFVEEVNDLDNVLSSGSKHNGCGGHSAARSMAKNRSMNEASSVEVAKRLCLLVTYLVRQKGKGHVLGWVSGR